MFLKKCGLKRAVVLCASGLLLGAGTQLNAMQNNNVQAPRFTIDEVKFREGSAKKIFNVPATFFFSADKKSSANVWDALRDLNQDFRCEAENITVKRLKELLLEKGSVNSCCSISAWFLLRLREAGRTYPDDDPVKGVFGGPITCSNPCCTDLLKFKKQSLLDRKEKSKKILSQGQKHDVVFEF